MEGPALSAPYFQEKTSGFLMPQDFALLSSTLLNLFLSSLHWRYSVLWPDPGLWGEVLSESWPVPQELHNLALPGPVKTFDIHQHSSFNSICLPHHTQLHHIKLCSHEECTLLFIYILLLRLETWLHCSLLFGCCTELLQQRHWIMNNVSKPLQNIPWWSCFSCSDRYDPQELLSFGFTYDAHTSNIFPTYYHRVKHPFCCLNHIILQQTRFLHYLETV